jgi:WD40 repeat protein
MEIGQPMTHGSAVMSAGFSKDESRVLTASDDKTARIWEAATGKQIGRSMTHDASLFGAAFSSDDSRVLSWGEDNTARIWDATSGSQVGPALTHGGYVWGAVYSADEKRILTWSEDGSMHLWDAATGRQIGPTLLHDGRIIDARFSKNEHYILTSSEDKTVRLWDVRLALSTQPSDLTNALCQTNLRGEGVAGRPLAAQGEKPDDPLVKATGQPIFLGPRILDAVETNAAPILRGREGEDVCKWSPPWYDGILNATLGWAFP